MTTKSSKRAKTLRRILKSDNNKKSTYKDTNELENDYNSVIEIIKNPDIKSFIDIIQLTDVKYYLEYNELDYKIFKLCIKYRRESLLEFIQF